MTREELEEYASASAREAVDLIRRDRRQERIAKLLTKARCGQDRLTYVQNCDLKLILNLILDLEERLEEIEGPRSE